MEQSANDMVLQIVHGSICCVLGELFKDISTDYKIPYDELCDKYLTRFKNEDKYKSIKVAKPKVATAGVASNNNNLDPNKCIARTQSGNQCQRKGNTGLFCKGHATSQPYGRMDQQPPQPQPKKRSTASRSDSSGLTKENLKVFTDQDKTSSQSVMNTYIKSLPPQTTASCADDDDDDIIVEPIIVNGVTYFRDMETNCVYNEVLDAHVGEYDTTTSSIKFF